MEKEVTGIFRQVLTFYAEEKWARSLTVKGWWERGRVIFLY
jgi:hypothetical protein